ncbi:hypothetical protein OSSY52_15380 [Tepiditoga spiralis]|uniref:Flagellar FliJ protein n=1 Tax=Tepiditoga spiralis TaxID=2108365 RepID=A0A7G1G8V0_9BACT|nr:flagellar export protein FliJ [Tepiditoga spiralis]BBE31397.1 hypothetical protein OSSY52_15380 [Tepiditoga spiralis]
MKFIFNLQRLMDLRKKFEEMAKDEFKKKVKERIEVEEQIEQIDKKIDGFVSSFNNELTYSVSPMRFKQLIEYREYLKKERVKLIKLYQIKLREEESAREDYLEAKKEKDILDKLKQRKLENYNYEMKLSEIKELDEIAQKMYVQKNKEK